MNIKTAKNYISFIGVLMSVLVLGFFIGTPVVQAVCDEDLGPTIATTMPSNLDSDSATLNAYFSARDACFTDFNRPQVVFEFGDSPDLNDQSTPISVMMGASSVSVEVNSLESGQSYYYRAVMYYGNSIVKGDKVKFTTHSTDNSHDGLNVTESDNIIDASNNNNSNSNSNSNNNSNSNSNSNSSNSNSTSRNASNSNGVASLSIDNDQEIVRNGEFVTYEITYANITSDKELEDAVILVSLPEGMTYVSGSEGVSYSTNRNAVIMNVRDIEPKEGGEYSVTVRVRNIKLDEAIAEVKLTYRDVDTHSRETLTAYDIDEVDATQNTALAAGLFGSGFLPGNAFGWLLVAVLLIAIIYLVRVHVWKFYWKDDGAPKGTLKAQEHRIGEAPHAHTRA